MLARTWSLLQLAELFVTSIVPFRRCFAKKKLKKLQQKN